MNAYSPPDLKSLRVAFILLGDRNKASSRVRGYWIGEELEALGRRVSYYHAPQRRDYLQILAVAARHDVLIFQKQYSHYDIILLRVANRMGKRVFFDIDDAPSRAEHEISRRNAATMMREAHGIFGGIDGLTLDLVDQVDWSDPEAVSAAVADFDIGLYPLIENPFNIYKCAFKALEYMATSIPVVASDVGANGDVVTNESDGYLVSSPEAWIACLSHLIADSRERRDFGSKGHAKVEERYSTKALAAQISELL